MKVTEGNLSTLSSGKSEVAGNEPKKESQLHTHIPSPKHEETPPEGGLNDTERNTLLSIINKPHSSPSREQVSFGELLKKDEEENPEGDIPSSKSATDIPSEASIYYNPDVSSSSSSDDEKEENKVEESSELGDVSVPVTTDDLQIELQVDTVVEEVGEGTIDKDSDNETSTKEDSQTEEEMTRDNDTEQQGDDKI